MNETTSPNDLILQLLREKSVVKQDVFAHTITKFSELKNTLNDLSREVGSVIQKEDKRIHVNYQDKGEFEAQFQLAGDLLVFNMHTNVFLFDNDHPLWKSSYLKEDPSRAYCGIINVFNFLADSLKYNRMNDVGYLVARIFVNKENHFMVQGKRQLGFLYNDFINGVLDEKALKAISQSLLLYTLDFDLYTPPYEIIKEISVMEIKELSDNMQIKTGKRLGFKFQADSDDIF